MGGAKKPTGRVKKPAKKPPGGPRSPDLEVEERVNFAVKLFVDGSRGRDLIDQLTKKYGKSERTHREDMRKATDRLTRDWATEDKQALAWARAALMGTYRRAREAYDEAREAAMHEGVVLDPRAAAQLFKVELQVVAQLSELGGVRPQDIANLARAKQDDVVTEVVNDGRDLVRGWIDQLRGAGGLEAVLDRDLQATAGHPP